MVPTFQLKLLCLGFLVLIHMLGPAFAQNKFATGVVFEDGNENGIQDPGEPGITDVSVSNQQDVVRTDRQVRYVLEVTDRTILFVSQPAGYRAPPDENNLPRFYYIHYPQGSPGDPEFKGVEPTGELPESVNFPLIKTERTNNFLAIFSGDPQPRDEKEVNYFRDDIVAQMKVTPAEFYLALGDIAYDDLNTYAPYNRAVAQLGIPAFNVHGNHDMNLDVPSDEYAAETFKRVFGPEYYSFNYGQVHFVVLDDVDYAGWDEEKNQRGEYRAYLSAKQLTWLRNDLSFVPEDHLIVLAMHIPIATEILPDHQIENRDRLFEILKFREHILAVHAHLHMMEQLEFTPEMGWQGTAIFRGMSLGAACGAWWSGPKDARGIPESFTLDGVPNGYFVFSFDGNRYNRHFYPANQPADFQMRIVGPGKIVAADSLSSRPVIVNVFNGGPRTTVMLSVGYGRPVRMKQTLMKDPSMVKYLQENRDTFADWIKKVPFSTHIWTVPLPTDLTVGSHTLTIKAVDRLGNIYTGSYDFEIR